MASPLPPPVTWAQRKDQLFVNIDLQDVQNAKINLTENTLSFSGTSSKKDYKCELTFLKEIDPSQSKYAVKPRSVEFILAKKESGPYWERLLKDAGKPKWLKADWNKWKDEDDVDDETGGFDASGMDAFDFGSGMPDFNMDGSDSDDEELPDLEEEGKKKEEGEKKEEEKKEEEKKEEEKKDS